MSMMDSHAGAGTRSTLTVRRWRDERWEATGYMPDSPYVERFWLPVIGPSTTWLLRRFAWLLADRPAAEVDLAELGVSLGLGGGTGRQSAVARSVQRACQFGLAHREGPGEIRVRVRLPTLSERQLERLPPALLSLHEAWSAASPSPQAVDRSLRLARCLISLGERPEGVARQLNSWGVEPPIASEAAERAWRGTSPGPGPTGSGPLAGPPPIGAPGLGAPPVGRPEPVVARGR